jgi:hypothetical protein
LLLAAIERRLGVANRLAAGIEDRRDPDRVPHGLAEMIRYRALLIAAGYPDGNGCDALKSDPAFKMAVDHRQQIPDTASYRCLLAAAALRGLAPRTSFWRDTQFDTISRCLIKAAARVTLRDPNARQVDEAPRHRDVGDIHRPRLIGPRHRQPTQQVRVDLVARRGFGGVRPAIKLRDAHPPHRPRHVLAASFDALFPHRSRGIRLPRERVFEMQFVDPRRSLPLSGRKST